MASREKKVSLGRKLATASPVPSSDGANASLTKSESTNEEPQKAAIAKLTANKKLTLKKKVVKKVVKKTFKINSNKVTKRRKPILNKSKELKSTLIKNGVNKTKVIRKRIQTQPKNEEGDKPPVLEPIDEPADKKPKKKAVAKKIESETSNSISDTIEFIVNQSLKQLKKPKVMKKPKEVNSESIDDIMNDLSSLIDPENKRDVQTENLKKVVETVSDSSKIDMRKKKVGAKKTKMEIFKKKINKIPQSANSKVIDMLDLNVKVGKKAVKRRRHSIEKFQITTSDVPTQDMTIFSNLPRSISPKNKRTSRFRQSIDSKRSSPYTTRSDSPARILRNGKHRKLKHLNLLEGIDSEYKKRRRLCSDFSGSEISVSKLSGYESDSSFSDMASLHGAENLETPEATTKDLLIKKELMETLENNPDAAVDVNNMPERLSAIIKRSLSTEAGNVVPKTIDTNSNLCSETPPPIKDECIFSDEFVHPSVKLPEKGLLLGIMKQAFNVTEDPQERAKRKTRSSVRKIAKPLEETPGMSTTQFYGSPVVDGEDLLIKPAEIKEVDSPKPIIKDVYTFDEQEEKYEEKTAVAEIIETPEVEECKKDEIAEINKEEENDGAIAVIESETVPVKTLENIDKIIENITEQMMVVDPEIPQQNGDNNHVQDMEPNISTVVEDSTERRMEIVESPEDMAIKNQILKALGLQSLQAAEEAAKLRKQVPKTDSYTGTLKTVIKLNRLDKKKGRNSLKMTLQKKGKSVATHGKDDDLVRMEEDEYKIMKEGTSSWKPHHGGQSSDSAGAQRKTHYSNRSNMDGSSEHTSDGDTVGTEGEGPPAVPGPVKILVIPEKASSFSIHPGRLCKDECSYCFGKFGLFDTPCHIAQMKSVDRQNKILTAEKHLTHDSCLCDACYRHVDRKSNAPSYNTNNRSYKRNALVAPGPRQNHCHVLGCGRLATNILRRKWLMKMRKSVCEVINIDLDNPGLHSIPICEEHYASLEHLMVCAMCKRRLARNHIHYLGSESNDLNSALNEMGIPVKLHDKPVVCKLCRYFATLVLKNAEDRSENSISFFREYRKRLLHFHDIEVMDDEHVEEPIPMPEKNKEQIKKKKKLKNQNLGPPVLEPQVDIETLDEPNSRVPSSESRPESPSDYMVDYNTLIPNIALDCGTDIEITRKELSKKSAVSIKRITKTETIKETVDKSKKLKNKSDIAVQRLGSNPSISVRQLFPGEEDLPLNGNIEFHHIKERTPEGWEKCSTTIQYDPDTKLLWNELQKPYGNQSSFLRHLIILEKYFRNGDLVLSQTATHHSINYTESVQNRLRAYDNIPSNSAAIQPLSMIPFNKAHRSTSGIITSKEVPASKPIVSKSMLQPPKNTQMLLIPPEVNHSPPERHLPKLHPKAYPPKLNPQLNIPHLNPQLNIPHLNPQLNIPHLNPQVNIPHLNPQNNPHLNPQNNPQNNPHLNPQNIPHLNPQVNIPHLNPQLNIPHLNPIPSQMTVTQIPPHKLSKTNHSSQSNLSVPSQINLSQSSPISITQSSPISISQASPIAINSAPLHTTAISSNSNHTQKSSTETNAKTSSQLNLISPATAAVSQLGLNPASLISPPPAPLQVNQANIPKNTPITMSLLSSNNFLVPNPAAMSMAPISTSTITTGAPNRTKLPPGLISLQPGTKIPVTPLVKVPQPQKIKFPITKNWRPNLIPIDPNKKPEKKPGLVQVISGGKPYHITLEDYKKMCAIKRTFDLRQKRMLESQKSGSILKNLQPRKGLSISKSSTITSSPTKNESNSDDPELLAAENVSDKTADKLQQDKAAVMIMPKIPKSLTVIPQTVAKKNARSPSPALLITPRHKSAGKS